MKEQIKLKEPIQQIGEGEHCGIVVLHDTKFPHLSLATQASGPYHYYDLIVRLSHKEDGRIFLYVDFDTDAENVKLWKHYGPIGRRECSVPFGTLVSYDEKRLQAWWKRNIVSLATRLSKGKTKLCDKAKDIRGQNNGN